MSFPSIFAYLRLIILLAASWSHTVFSQDLRGEYVKYGDQFWSRCSYGQKYSGGTCVGEARRVGYESLDSILIEVNQRFDSASGAWIIPSIYDLAKILSCDSGLYQARDVISPEMPAIANWCGGSFTAPTLSALQFPNTPPSIFWSSTKASRRIPSSWVMNFKDGYVMDHPNSHQFYLRLLWVGSSSPQPKVQLKVEPTISAAAQDASTIRAQAQPQPQAASHFRILTDGQYVQDSRNGLVWSRCSLGQTWNGTSCAGAATPLTIDVAQITVEQINATSKLDQKERWRMPTVRELMSLVQCSSGITRFSDDPGDGVGKIDNWCDGSFVRPTINSEVFPDTPARRYWTMTPYQDSKTANWGVLFNTGRMSADLRLEKNLVRLVRESK